MLDTPYDALLVMYDVRHLECSIAGCTYHPYWPCGVQVPLLYSLLCTEVLVTGGGYRSSVVVEGAVQILIL